MGFKSNNANQFLQQFSCSDLTTAIEAANNVAYFRAPVAFTLEEITASLFETQTSGSIFTVNVKKNGTTVFSTQITIDNNEKTSVTAATKPVISVISVAYDDIITVDVVQVGNGTAKGLIVCLKGSY